MKAGVMVNTGFVKTASRTIHMLWGLLYGAIGEVSPAA